MTAPEPASFTLADLADPSVPAATLGQLAGSRPDLWNAIVAHPNCYPGLAEWIGQQTQNPAPPPTAAEQSPQPVPEAEWTARFSREQGREPLLSEYHAAVAAGEIITERKASDVSVEQMAAGAKQMASGAKQYFTKTVAPAASGAAKSIHNAVNERSAQSPSSAMWPTVTQITILVAAFIGLFSLFLPLASVSGFGISASINFFSDELAAELGSDSKGGEGVILVLFMLALMALTVISLVFRKRWARIAVSVVAIIVGLVCMFDGFVMMVNFSRMSFVTLGAGLVLLAFVGIVLVVAGTLTLLLKKPTPVSPAV
ncbi:variant leucine-rich repeat-containing protein [Salinibacterium sp. PAMC 21357]|uniref:variant leucine-rich repeat-containing protein n=1 Tax=Salinibacterium sp. PAMC 21357 TaxID=1112215 RepID=UPI0002898E08|nr:hypothetical protein [Salinibacterium sp. PAMC 21357]